MQEGPEDFKAELRKPRIGFLIVSGILAVLAIGVYFYEAEIVADNSALAYILILIVLVLATMFFLLCYRVPHIGNRLLGHHKMIDNEEKAVKSDVQFSAGFKQETAADKKRMNTKRKQARYSRRKFAAVTREMNEEKKQSADATVQAEENATDQSKQSKTE